MEEAIHRNEKRKSIVEIGVADAKEKVEDYKLNKL